MIKNKIILFLIAVSFFSCKAEPPINDLNVPMGLIGTYDGAKIKLSFYAFNPEPNFYGFNVYITDCSVENNWDLIQGKVLQHIVGSTFNLTINNDYIISSTAVAAPNKTFPTILSSSANGVTTKSTLVSYSVTYDAYNNAISLASNYCIGVTAIDMNDFIESALSNAIRCNGTLCTGI